MSRSIYIVNPKCDAPSYYTAEVFGIRGLSPAVIVADLAIVTLAAMAPPDFEPTVCDEVLTPIDFNLRPDFVAITGKVSQWGRMREVADEFRQRGVTVLIGGPHATLSPDLVRPHCDILVRGEVEEIVADLFDDLRRGAWKSEYVGTKPSLDQGIIPRWDLYPNAGAVFGALQTSRGCPFECEFCDVIEYLGRKQRHKPIDQVLAELDVLYCHGYRAVFLADDNFTVYRTRAKALLQSLKVWNSQQAEGPISFVTQVSIDAASDDEMLRMCAEAGVNHVFIGIETPNEESLRLSKKRQNLKRDLVAAVRRFVEHGIGVDGGMIVGFDGDDVGIFETQYEFARSTPIPIFTLGALVAPAATPLHSRLQAAGRLTDDGSEVAATPWTTNIIPDRMTRDELADGIRWLCNALYKPEAFEARLFDFLDTFGSAFLAPSQDIPRKNARRIQFDTLKIAMSLAQRGPAEAGMVARVLERLRVRPNLAYVVFFQLMRYAQVRFIYEAADLWDSGPAKGPLRKAQHEGAAAVGYDLAL